MARRRKRGAADYILDLVARVPWWGYGVLAILLHLALRNIAVQRQTPPGVAPLAATPFVWLTGNALVLGQYIAPALCCALALVSAWRRSKLKQIGLAGAPLRAHGKPTTRQGPTSPFIPSVQCPDCGAPMARRNARRTSVARGDFWGCTAYPQCRGTRPYP